MPKIMPPQLLCTGCGRTIPNKDFFMNYNKYHVGYNYSRMTYCKACCKEISQSIMADYWDSKRNKNDKIAYSLGIRAICVFFHMPYVNEAMDKLRDYELKTTRDKDFNYVLKYGEALKTVEVPNEYWDNLSGNTFLAYDLFKKNNNNDVRLKNDGDMELLLGLEKDWGKQDRLDDYLWLEEKFNEYTKGEELTASMKNTMRYLCLAELEVIKLKEKKESTKDAEKKVMEYYKMLGLDNFKLKENKSIGEKWLEKWTAIEEQTRPLDMVDKLFADDICNIRKDNDDLMRCMKNLVVGSKEYPDLVDETK